MSRLDVSQSVSPFSNHRFKIEIILQQTNEYPSTHAWKTQTG